MLTRRDLLARVVLGGAALTVLRPVGALAAHPLPRGVHLSYTQDPATSMTATWFTDGTANPGTVVEFGRSGEPLAALAEGTASPTPGVGALTHRATLTGLKPGQPVDYRVGRPGAWSPVRTFTPHDGTSRFTLAHLGDWGQTNPSRATTAHLGNVEPDLVLVAGDLSYANGNQPLWDSWFAQIEPLAARVPVMAAAGNHENEDTAGEAFKARTSHPGPSPAYWSFDHGNMHIAATTAGVFLEDAKIVEELVWLDADLAVAAARRAAGEIDWVVVTQHYPLWTNHESRGPLNPSLVLAEEHILQRHQVDVVLVGHDHFYERSVRMAYGQPSPLGYVQIISGGGGQSLYDFVPAESFQSWSAAHAKRYHHMLYEVDGRTIRGAAIATDRPGEVIDAFELQARNPATLRPRRARSREQVALDVAPLLRGGELPPPGNCDLAVPRVRVR
jgi:hypothetical protein